ncbi:transcriptional regulator, TetR family [Austwickia chelonae]|uniref:HTH tetR-type domain-containing protein n=1 Tax=Austwickia chelonae NBRC 105200 TaxID=1184607 RepID=K6VQC8_9MICO|nr:TetR/AcrR family transcriptional regulator [Austwickia chelonae]GAB78949.1 hypothetical protein AUCHE_17_01630 [Austwickia chelonae NBRC 105200]SEV87128.1 transcriptional regulator, TetR family [Austwickia chelonae]
MTEIAAAPWPSVTATGEDDVEKRLLQAVREEILVVGLHRTTATAVARRAGVARVTLYRRSGGIRRLALSAVTIEAGEIVDHARIDLPGDTGLERTVEMSLRIIRAIAGSSLLQAIRTADLTLFEPYLTDHLGSSQRALMKAILPEIRCGLADGSIADGDPHALAVTLLHALTPFATAEGITRTEIGPEATEAQLRRLISGYLATPTPHTPEHDGTTP